MEAFTSGKVSTAAGKAYMADHPWLSVDQLVKIRGGYRMFAWQSQIDYCRAYGRGIASGDDRAPHPYDAKRAA
jgi:hypothetical protein